MATRARHGNGKIRLKERVDAGRRTSETPCRTQPSRGEFRVCGRNGEVMTRGRKQTASQRGLAPTTNLFDFPRDKLILVQKTLSLLHLTGDLIFSGEGDLLTSDRTFAGDRDRDLPRGDLARAGERTKRSRVSQVLRPLFCPSPFVLLIGSPHLSTGVELENPPLPPPFIRPCPEPDAGRFRPLSDSQLSRLSRLSRPSRRPSLSRLSPRPSSRRCPLLGRFSLLSPRGGGERVLSGEGSYRGRLWLL